MPSRTAFLRPPMTARSAQRVRANCYRIDAMPPSASANASAPPIRSGAGSPPQAGEEMSSALRLFPPPLAGEVVPPGPHEVRPEDKLRTGGGAIQVDGKRR